MDRARGGILAAGLMALAAAFVLAGYEFLRTPTNTLFVASFGKESLPYVTAMIPFSVAAATYIYVRLLSAFGPRRTLFITTIGAAGLIALGQVAENFGFKSATWVLFVVREVYVVLIIEQYWSFLNSTLSTAEARRFNGPICGIGSLGSVAAGIVGSQLTMRFGTATMMLFAAVATLPAAFIADATYRIFGEPKAPPEKAATPVGHLALSLFRTEKLLPLLFGVVIATQVVATVLGLAFQGALKDALPGTDEQTTYSYAFFAWVNGIAAVLQFAAAPILLHKVRPGLIHLFIPLVHVATCVTYFLQPNLTTLAVAYAAFKSIDYSIFRAAKELLYIPLPFAARYRVKEVIDVFGYRFSKGVASAGVSVLQEFAGVVFTESLYMGITLVLSLVWAGLAARLGRFYEKPAGFIAPTPQE